MIEWLDTEEILRRWIPAHKLAELLMKLPESAKVSANVHGNLYDDASLAYIDFGEEELHYFSDVL